MSRILINNYDRLDSPYVCVALAEVTKQVTTLKDRFSSGSITFNDKQVVRYFWRRTKIGFVMDLHKLKQV
jgi:hypothetical protein